MSTRRLAFVLSLVAWIVGTYWTIEVALYMPYLYAYYSYIAYSGVAAAVVLAVLALREH